ncbi:argininosuccinate lyase [Candidimonas nitroreducens]|uniref:argininosuccinate lyase n=1 Tax=Candidimonas nitroreducens TaxID=683354 RepID=A0A225M268_9BURK|nr:argininosuccinate lyase [Candidimonas nitroreducens]OWT54792.1 argininosuccinate lyase [Candidimonas nitroreducens]
MNRKTALLICVLLGAPAAATAADTGQAPCHTTEQCNREAAKAGVMGGTRVGAGLATSQADQAQDQFYWLNQINRASAVMLTEEKIISPEMGRKIAKGVQYVIDQAAKPGGRRPKDVLQIERIITEDIGPDASLVHTGRSRQDMYATFRMAKLRTELLDYSDALDSLRRRILATAAKNVETYIPAYTNGVQAMPITYAHYLLAYEASFDRDAQRIHELYKRLNRSAMGTAVLANSSWPLNRKRMADLLGFDGIIENSMDSSQVAPSDISLEAMGIVSSTAIRLGAILGDIHTQYHQTRPWMLLNEGATYTSSAMPQKRNPGVIMRAREAASNVVGLAQTVVFRAHNVTTGMTDYKDPWAQIGFFPQAMQMIKDMNVVMDALTVNPKRSLEELENDWTTSMELAETLQREDKIPFRVGHRFASAIVTYARANGYKPKDFPYDKAVELYAEAIRKFKLPDSTKLPMSEAEFRQTLSPVYMVNTRVGIGGPQPPEVRRMLGEAQATLKADEDWMSQTRKRLADANTRLDQAFAQLRDSGS